MPRPPQAPAIWGSLTPPPPLAGLLPTPNLFQLPQQSPGGLLPNQPRGGLPAQVRGGAVPGGGGGLHPLTPPPPPPSLPARGLCHGVRGGVPPQTPPPNPFSPSQRLGRASPSPTCPPGPPQNAWTPPRTPKNPATWRSWSNSPAPSSSGASSWASPRYFDLFFFGGGSFSGSWVLLEGRKGGDTPPPNPDTPPALLPGRCGAGDGEAVRERLQPNDHLALRGAQPQLQEHVQAQAAAGEVAQRRR